MRLRALVLMIVVVTASPAWGHHALDDGGHWSHKRTPFSIPLGDDVGSRWDNALRVVAKDWSKSSVLDTPVVPGVDPLCYRDMIRRQIEVCADYYNAPWYGLASMFILHGHFTIAFIDLDNANTYTWRKRVHVLCQEVGHTLGLDHRKDAGTCMNSRYDALGSMHPDAHDYAELKAIYAHLD
jgi:hypothetical protein